MRKLRSYLKSLGSDIATKKFIVDGEFPGDCIIWDNPTLKGVRLMVDPVYGNDNNDGTTWDTAFKSIYKALNVIPEDLKGRHALILLHPGEHLVNEDEILTIKNKNGAVRLVWVGTFINKSEGKTDINGYYNWVRNGKDNPIRNNNQVIIKFADNVTNTWSLLHAFDTSVKSLVISFEARDYNYIFNQVGFAYWDKFVFQGYEGRTPISSSPLLYFEGVRWDQDPPITLDLRGSKIACVFSRINGFICNMKIIGGSGQASTSTSSWQSIIHLGEGSDFYVKNESAAFAVGYEPENGKHYNFTNFKSNFMSVFPSGGGGKIIMAHLSTSKIQVDNSAIGNEKPGLYLTDSTLAGSKVEYNNSIFNFTDTATNQHTVKEYNELNALVSSKIYLSPKIIDDNGNFKYLGGAIFTLPTADPHIIGALWNNAGVVTVSAG